MEEILRRLQKEASGHKHKAVRDACVYACGEFRRFKTNKKLTNGMTGEKSSVAGSGVFYSKCVVVELPVWLHLLLCWCSLSNRLPVGEADFPALCVGH